MMCFYYLMIGIKMLISGNEKLKAQKIVTKIQTGDFDELDVDSLLMRLREYSKGLKKFQEVANFSAHNAKRDRGILNESIHEMHLNFSYIQSYLSGRKQLFIDRPFPSYIVKLFKYKALRYSFKLLKKRFELKEANSSLYIDGLFLIDKDKQLASLARKIQKNDLHFLKFLLETMIVAPAFSQEELIKEIVLAIKLNRITISEKDFIRHSDKIGVCILVLMHNTIFEIDDGGSAKCMICESFDDRFEKDGRAMRPNANENFIQDKVLSIVGTFKVIRNNDPDDFIFIKHSIYTTKLNTLTWCDETLIEKNSDINGGNIFSVNFDRSLTVNNEFKIIEIME